MKAISIRQPWAHSIIHYGKRVENRSWKTAFRGPVLIHAAKGCGKTEFESAADDIRQIIGAMPISRSMVDFGGIIGRAEIVDCVSASTSPWFSGPYGFVLANVEALPFRPCRGALGFFWPEVFEW